MKKYVFFILAVFLLHSCQQSPKQTQQDPMNHESMSQEEMMAHSNDGVRDGVFIHITESYNDPHKVLMPLKMAGFKEEDLIEGVKLAQKDKFFNFTKGRIITLDY